jgi:hypothetical protein
MTVDDRAVASLLMQQRGVLSRSQALRLVTGKSALQHRLRPGGPWQRLLPGIYLTVTGTPTWEQLETAALLHAGPHAVLTGPAALRNYRIRTADIRVIDVLVPAQRQVTSAGFVAIHRTRRMPQTVTVDLALRFAPVDRAVADTVRTLDGLAEARAVVAGAVQQRHCTIEQLAAELRAGPIRDSRRLRAVLAEVIAGIRSPAEADFRTLIIRSGLPRPLFNARLFLGETFLAQPDAWWPAYGLAVEVDSREWHLLPEHWEQTMARHRRMSAAGITVMHVSPRQVRDQEAELIGQIDMAMRSGRPLPAISTRPLAA